MSDTRLKGIRRGIFAAAGALFLLAAGQGATGLYVDALWFAESGYPDLFWSRLGWIWGVRAAAALGVALFVFVNLRRVAASLGTVHIRRRFGNLEIAERLPERYVRATVLGLSLLFGLWFGAAVPDSVGESALLRMASGPWGLSEPVLGQDIGFYVFSLPLLRAMVTFGLVVGFLTLTISIAGYATTGVLSLSEGGMVMTHGARRHLGLLLAGFLVLLAARFWLGRSLLLLGGTSDVQGIFGYTDAVARMPALRIQALLALAGAVGVLVGAWRNRLMPAVAGVTSVALGVLVVGQLYPGLVQRFQVVPNELGRETPWIDVNLEQTRRAYGLHEMERAPYTARASGDVDWAEAQVQLQGLPVWTPNTLLTTYREVEARFRYYHFPTVAFDRYPGPDGDVPIALSVREIDPAGIEDPNWQNLHLRERYVTGNGLVASDATRRTPEGRPFNLVSGIPAVPSPAAPAALELQHASIFYGSRSQPYAILTPGGTDFAAPDGSPGQPGLDLPNGIELGSLARKLVFAWHLGEANLLFSSDITPDSRLVLHRGVRDRVRRIAPFFSFPEVPYPVLHEGRVVWVLEGFSQTRFFPLASPTSLEFGRATAYVRNSVKATVDATTGEVALYAVPVDDPIRDAVSNAFPGLIRPLDEMPTGLRSHLRYSRALLAVQSSVLLQYHQKTAETFFGQQDVWAVPRELEEGSTPVTYQPEYSLIRLPGDEHAEFRLVTAFVPAGRQNLTGVLAGELTGEGAPRLRLFDVPVENQVPGPRQVEALIEQDPEISQQFSLWRTGGSRVWTGHLHVVPVGDRTVYMEPVFLAAEEDAIPELRRFVVSDGQSVAMRETLAGAVAALAGSSLAEGAMPAPARAALAPGAMPQPLAVSEWPVEALRLLEQAEDRARAGDWAGFGTALDDLRRTLQQARDRAPAGAGDSPGGAR